MAGGEPAGGGSRGGPNQEPVRPLRTGAREASGRGASGVGAARVRVAVLFGGGGGILPETRPHRGLSSEALQSRQAAIGRRSGGVGRSSLHDKRAR